MTMIKAKEWEVTLSLTRTLKFSVEEGEDEEEFRAWIDSDDGCNRIRDDFTKGMQTTGYYGNTDVEVIEIELAETEVKGTDTDPRV